MIQRIQTVYWSLVCGLMLVLLFGDFSVNLLSQVKTIGIAVLSIIAVFLYKKRKWQSWCGYLISFGLLLDCIFFFISCYQEAKDLSTFGLDIKNFGIPLAIMIIALIFNCLAIRAVKKDEKLVRSTDRLR